MNVGHVSLHAGSRQRSSGPRTDQVVDRGGDRSGRVRPADVASGAVCVDRHGQRQQVGLVKGP